MLTTSRLKEGCMTRNFRTLKEAGAYLNISTRSVRRLIDRRMLTFYKIGGLVKVDEDDLENYLKRSRIVADGADDFETKKITEN